MIGSKTSQTISQFNHALQSGSIPRPVRDIRRITGYLEHSYWLITDLKAIYYVHVRHYYESCIEPRRVLESAHQSNGSVRTRPGTKSSCICCCFQMLEPLSINELN